MYQDVQVNTTDLNFQARFRAVDFSNTGGLVQIKIKMFSEKPPGWSGNPPDISNLSAIQSLTVGQISWYFRPDYVYPSNNVSYWELLGTGPSGWSFLDVNLHDNIIAHLPGIDESQVKWLRIWIGTYGESGGFTVGNFDDISLGKSLINGPNSGYEGEELIFTAQVVDPGSDDLIFTWNWGDGTSDTVTVHYNNGVGPEPVYNPATNEIKSPKGSYPFLAIDTAGHVYGDDGNFTITLTVMDDDGGFAVYETYVLVNNVPPFILSINYSIVLINKPRTIGYWGHQCEVKEPGGDHTGILQEWVDNISSQSQVFSWISTKEDVCSVVQEGDARDMIVMAKRQLMGMWLNVVSGKLHPETEIDMPTLTTLKTIWDAILEIEDVILNSNNRTELERVKNIADNINNGNGIALCIVEFIATATDPGADDLNFYWDFGDGKSQDNFYPNPGGVFPITASDYVMHSYFSLGSFTVTLTVSDDDGGTTTTTLMIELVG
jgi:hypothetical protein